MTSLKGKPYFFFTRESFQKLCKDSVKDLSSYEKYLSQDPSNIEALEATIRNELKNELGDFNKLNIWISEIEFEKSFETFSMMAKSNILLSTEQIEIKAQPVSQLNELKKKNFFFVEAKLKEGDIFVFYDKNPILKCNWCISILSKRKNEKVCDCKKAYYCNKNCLTRDLLTHKYVCENLTNSEFKEEAALSKAKADYKNGVVGIKNEGQTCYIASAFQLISNLEHLRIHFLTDKYKEIVEKNKIVITNSLSMHVAAFMKKLWYGSANYVHLTYLRDYIKKNFQAFNNNAQQDVHEFLSLILSKLNEENQQILGSQEMLDTDNRELKKLRVEQKFQNKKAISIVADLLGQETRSLIVCQKCQFNTSNIETNLICSLAIPKSDQTRTIDRRDNDTKTEKKTEKIHFHLFSPEKVRLEFKFEYEESGTSEVNLSEIINSLVKERVLTEEDSKHLEFYQTNFESLERKEPTFSVKKMASLQKESENLLIRYVPIQERQILPKKKLEIHIESTLIYAENPRFKHPNSSMRIFYLDWEASVEDLYVRAFEQFAKDHYKHSYIRDSSLRVNFNHLYKNVEKKPFELYYSTYRYEKIKTSVEAYMDEKKLKRYDTELVACSENKTIKERFSLSGEDASRVGNFEGQPGILRIEMRWKDQKIGEISKTTFLKKEKASNKSSSENNLLFLLRKHFLSDEILQGAEKWKCPKCKDKVEAKKNLELMRISEYLIFHIKRFEFNENNHQIKKISDLITFPLKNLNIGEFLPFIQASKEISSDDDDLLEVTQTFSMNRSSNCTVKKAKIKTNDEKKPQNLYDLITVINHEGSGWENGHYYSYCLQRNKWLNFNDDKISELNEDDIVKSQAYILVYKRKN